MNRGDIHWFDFGEARGSTPAKRRPVVIVQADSYNRSRLATVLVVALSSNSNLAERPGNVYLPATATGLSKDSVVNVTTVTTVNKHELDSIAVGSVPAQLMQDVDAGLRLVLGLR